jgi:hypothetical protein
LTQGRKMIMAKRVVNKGSQTPKGPKAYGHVMRVSTAAFEAIRKARAGGKLTVSEAIVAACAALERKKR